MELKLTYFITSLALGIAVPGKVEIGAGAIQRIKREFW
jgi:hypothetical protein